MKQIQGQISLFSVIWEHFSGCTVGKCSCCGNQVAYSSGGYGFDDDVWIDEECRCSNCGAVFTKADGKIPKGLPLLSGITRTPIVLTIDLTGYTQEDIDRNGGIEWLKHRRCTEWFNSTDTANIDRYISEQEKLCRK